MKKLMYAILGALTFAAAAQADEGYFDANVHVLAGDNIVTAEYSWANGRFNGYGFADKSLDTDFVITDHEVRMQVTGPLYASTEIGYNHFGGEMGKIGAGANLAGLPTVEDAFVYLNVYAQKTVFGPGGDHLVGAAWGTKDLDITSDVSVYVSGFADYKDGAPNVIQHQLWLTFDGSPIELGTELAFFGSERSVSAAVKLKF